ncbi:pentapeptide repeat-containing protein [Actinomadura sp. K4S16]|uniref:pentapeptide repeat-containing protein n=1 Tax=Actinomadura sp. K4S16 TaxID=1316147 RepID=UPI0011F073F3|nr:pentapeptide repeat-containing protein [Actinomadura sp. K4S16]
MLAAAGAAVLAIWLTTAWLLDVADDAPPGTDRARIRVDAVRTGLAAGGGAGAAVGLMLAFRRQRHAELATALGQLDAAERRITELYNAAAEQLGSDKAPVRLTALYTLERLANDNERHRQTIVNIICAYLRMPYTPPDSSDRERAARELRRYYAARYQAACAGRPIPEAPYGPDAGEEQQVRLTAQRILTDHLQNHARVHWADVSLDLTGAHLTDFNMTVSTLVVADFEGATFTGYTHFSRATVTGAATFRSATFTGPAYFDAATLTRAADFQSASFRGPAVFQGTTFAMAAFFDGAVFVDRAVFDQAIFEDKAFRMAPASSGPGLRGAAFFAKAAFASHASFQKAAFTGAAIFSESAFDGEVELGEATVADTRHGHVLPPGWRIEPAEGTTGRIVEDSAPAPSGG